jgi:hypothetical protein
VWRVAAGRLLFERPTGWVARRGQRLTRCSRVSTVRTFFRVGNRLTDWKQRAHSFRKEKPRRATGMVGSATMRWCNGLMSGARPRGRAGEHPATARRQRVCGDADTATHEGKALEGEASARRVCHRLLRERGGTQNPVNLMVGSGTQQAHEPRGGVIRTGGEKPRMRPVTCAW